MKHDNRKLFLSNRSIGLLLFLLILNGNGVYAQNLSDDERPNILFIAIDDLNDWIGFLPKSTSNVNTPNLDRIAQSGFWFSNAHASAASCNPSRVSILTGISPAASHVTANKDSPYRRFLPHTITMNNFFSDMGYKVYGTGKIYHGKTDDQEYWDKYIDYLERPEPDRDSYNRKKPVFDWEAIDQPEQNWAEYKQATFAINLLDTVRNPAFIAIGFRLPHLPWFIPKNYYDKHINSEDLLPTILTTDTDDLGPLALELGDSYSYNKIRNDNLYEDAVACYKAAISFVDAQVGRIFEYAEKTNTLVILWSDHGWQLGEKNKWKKSTVWERSTRVPLIFYWDGHISPGHSNSVVSLMDIFPTTCDFLDLKAPNLLQGTSLVPIISGQKEHVNKYVLTVTKDVYSIRTDSSRYINYSPEEDEFYLNKKDTLEWHNLINSSELSYTISKHKVITDSIRSFSSIPTISSVPRWSFSYNGVMNQIKMNLEIETTNMSWVEMEFSRSNTFQQILFRKRIYQDTSTISIPNTLCSGAYYLRIREVNPISKSNWSRKDTLYMENDLDYCDEKVYVYPNPSSTTFTLYFENPRPGKNLSVLITDTLGRVVKRINYPQLDCNTCYTHFDDMILEGGIYMVSIISGSETRGVKLVIQANPDR